MFQLPSHIAGLTLQHRHSDGSWGDLERVQHDVAAHDPERDWANGELYVCSTCQEEVRVKPAPGTPRDGDAR
jgi:hypothetical protein